MKDWRSNLCQDAGSEFCPCYLADIRRCVNCALLSGHEDCRCEWTGTCIYSEYLWNEERSKSPRMTVPAFFVQKTIVGKNTIVLSLKLPRWLARELRAPGSFIFLRPANVPEYFECPLSVMQVDKDYSTIHIAVQMVGPKTWAITREEGQFLARGPFLSGILGLTSLKIPAKQVLIVTKGVAQGHAVHTANYLARRQVKVTVAIGPGPVGTVFATRWLDDGAAEVIELDRKPDHNRHDIADLLRSSSWDVVISAGPDIQHRMIYTLVSELLPGTRMAFTNNALMCCGEGVCGACGSVTSDPTARACKANPDTEVLAFLRETAGGNDI